MLCSASASPSADARQCAFKASRICSSCMDCLQVRCALRGSATLWNETWAAGLHYLVEPLSGLNAIDFVERLFRKRGDVEILPRAGRTLGRGQKRRAALHCPSQQHLRWRSSKSCGDCRNDWIFDQPGPHAVTQRGEGQEHNVLLLAEFQKLGFRQIRMRFDLDHGWLDSRCFVDGHQLIQTDVRQSDGAASATVHQALHRLPRVEQSHAAVVDDIAVFIAWILLVPGLKRKGSVDEIEIQIGDAESVETRLESGLDALGPMIGVPQLCGDKDVRARDASSGKSGLQGLTYLTVVAVSLRTIEVSKSCFQRISGRTFRHGWIWNQGAKAECGDMAGSVVERDSRGPKIRGSDHG